ncbi:MAG TPA: hypothetical protein VGR91_20030 [Stellaceae bacterium]|nr:hypothetical protein [Stellaceae bacterium]
MFKPWIGQEYDTTRLLLLGESAYSWWEADEQRHPSPEHSIDMVEWAVDNFPHCGRFFAMLCRALANQQEPNKERLRSVWDRVGFTNYVSTTVLEGTRARPSPAQWREANKSFLPDLSEFFKVLPRRIIVLGKTMWGNMPDDTEVYPADDVQGYRVADNIVMCHAVDHPAGGLSWRRLAGVIHFTYQRELRA